MRPGWRTAHAAARLFSSCPGRCATKRPCSRAPASARSPTASSSLVVGELVFHAQAAGIQHLVPVDDERILEAAAARQTGLLSCSTSRASAKVRACCDLVAEAVGRETQCAGLAADRLGGEVDRQFHFQHRLRVARERAASGRSSTQASPAVTRTGRGFRCTRRGASCSTTPAQSSRNT